MRLPVRTSGSALAAVATAVFLLPGPGGNRLTAQSAVHPLAEAPSYGDLAPAVEYARAMLESMRTERGVPGLSGAVGVDGQVVWSDPESSRLSIVAVDDHGNPTHITLDDSGASAAGSWFDGNRGELSCTHEAP